MNFYLNLLADKELGPYVLFVTLIVVVAVIALIVSFVRSFFKAPPPPPPPKEKGILDLLTEGIQQRWEANVPQSIVTEDGVTVNYRFAGSLVFLPKSPEEEKAFIEKTDAEIRRILKNDRLADLTKFEITLKIKVRSVQIGLPTRGRSGSEKPPDLWT